MKLTAAQTLALGVLAEKPGEWVPGHKRRSCRLPRAFVNMRAADSLRRLGLAECSDRAMMSEAVRSAPSSRWVCTYRYRATTAGLREAGSE